MAEQVSKGFNVSTVVSVVTMLGAIGGAYATVQAQMVETKTTVTLLQRDREQDRVEVREDLKEIRADMKNLSARQDEILQRLSK